MNKLIIICVFIYVLNIPFGLWREKTVKFSKQWFLAVHLPVPLIIATRLFLNIPLTLKTFPLFVFFYFTGQFTGSVFYRLKQKFIFKDKEF